MRNLSAREAYAAMFVFLEHRYRLTNSDDLGALLGSMALLPDGDTADPALWNDWLNAVKASAGSNIGLNIELK